MSKVIDNLRDFKVWFDSWWVGGSGEETPDNGHPDYPEYLEKFSFGWAAWSEAQRIKQLKERNENESEN